MSGIMGKNLQNIFRKMFQKLLYAPPLNKGKHSLCLKEKLLNLLMT